MCDNKKKKTRFIKSPERKWIGKLFKNQKIHKKNSIGWKDPILKDENLLYNFYNK